MNQHPAFKPLTRDCVADVFGVSTRTIENWVNEGLMPIPVCIGNRVFWHPDVFYSCLDQRLRVPPKEIAVRVPSVDRAKSNSKEDSGLTKLRDQSARRIAVIERSFAD